MTFSLFFLKWLFFGAVAASASGAVVLLVLLVIDLKKRQMW